MSDRNSTIADRRSGKPENFGSQVKEVIEPWLLSGKLENSLGGQP
jgi:hypothetical protein